MMTTFSYAPLDDRVSDLISAVLERLVERFDLPEEITELPRPRRTPNDRARGFQTTLEDMLREAGGEMFGLSLVEEHGGHHKLDDFASVTGRGGLREFDVTLMDRDSGLVVLLELKWSSLKKGRSGVIFEQAWDAIKCALARVQYGGSKESMWVETWDSLKGEAPRPRDFAPVVKAYIVCGARESSWNETSVSDLFGHPVAGEKVDAAISVAKLWSRRVLRTNPPVTGPNGGETVGCDLHRGNATARVKASPDLVVAAHREVRSSFRGADEMWLTRIAAIEPATGARYRRTTPVPHGRDEAGVTTNPCDDPLCTVSW